MARKSMSPLWLRRVGIELLGWGLIVIGLAALVLPGPGLLTVTVGLIVLSWRYAWARRVVVPVKARAMMLAAQGVQTWPRIILSSLGALVIIALGIVWGIRPSPPAWWRFDDWWWLPGGWNTAVTLMASGVLALGLIVYSFHRFRRASH